MSPDPLPDFGHVLLLSRGELDAAELSECHGVLCGMICGENGNTAQDFMSHLSTLELAVEAGTSLHDVMSEAFDSTMQQLAERYDAVMDEENAKAETAASEPTTNLAKETS